MAAPTEWKTVPAYAAHMAMLLPQRPPAAVLIKDLRLLRSPFTRTRISLPLHCTACWSTFDVTCPVVLNLLPALNEWFVNLAVEIHEYKPGKLALTALEDSTELGISWEGNYAAILLHCLLTRHRCLEVLDGLHAALSCYPRVFCDALRKGPLNILRLSKCALTRSVTQSLMASIRRSDCLVELSLDWCKLCPSSIQSAESTVAGVIVRSKSLRFLNVANSSLFQKSAATLIRSLEKNRSIEKLVVGQSVLTCQQGTTFCRFLSNNRTLKALSIIFISSSQRSQRVDTVFDALLENTTLNKLTLKHFCLDFVSALHFGCLIIRNKSLSEVKFSCCSCDFTPVPELQIDDSRRQAQLCSYIASVTGSVSSTQNLALALKKSSLQRLSFEHNFSEGYNRQLFEAAASCSSLKELAFNTVHCEPSFYHALRDMRASGKVSLGTCYSKAEDFVSALKSCGDLLGLGSHRFLGLDKLEFHMVVEALPLYDHITGLELRLDKWDSVAQEDASLIADYLSSTRALKNISMKLNVSKELAHVIVEGLCKNVTIEQLSIEYWPTQDDDIRMLCSWMAASRKVYHLSYLCAEPQACWTLVRSLARLLPSCYTLTYVRIVEYPWNARTWLTIKQLMRRNLSVIECAVSFVLGSTLKRAAAAFERVSWHPQVASKVQKELRADPEEVSARFEECRRRLQMDFWQITGVVRGELVCHERDDEQRQIDQLGMDAWLCVRAFLSIDDVLDVPAKKQQLRKRKRR